MSSFVSVVAVGVGLVISDDRDLTKVKCIVSDSKKVCLKFPSICRSNKKRSICYLNEAINLIYHQGRAHSFITYAPKGGRGGQASCVRQCFVVIVTS